MDTSTTMDASEAADAPKLCVHQTVVTDAYENHTWMRIQGTYYCSHTNKSTDARKTNGRIQHQGHMQAHTKWGVFNKNPGHA